MLVLTRKPGEKIIIGNNICLQVVALGRNRVQLGITAPAEMPIRREEPGRVPDCPKGLDPCPAESQDATADQGPPRA
jgi:carbon storage regulator